MAAEGPTNPPGGSCDVVALCQGGSGGQGAAKNGQGFGMGSGYGASMTYGGGGGGGYGGGGGGRWQSPGCDGAGQVFKPPLPSTLVDKTDPTSKLGGGGAGGGQGTPAEDGHITITLSP